MKPRQSNREQHRRFVEKARQLSCSENEVEFNSIFKKVAKKPTQKGKHLFSNS